MSQKGVVQKSKIPRYKVKVKKKRSRHNSRSTQNTNLSTNQRNAANIIRQQHKEHRRSRTAISKRN